MDMEVWHSLTPVASVINDDPEARVRNPKSPSDFLCRE